METFVTIFDVLFLGSALAAVATLGVALVTALRGRWVHAGAILKRLGAAAAAYEALVLIVAAASPQRVLQVGEPWCFDDWCLTVEQVAKTPAPPQVAYTVSLRISSRARRVTQRAKGAWIYLIDRQGRRYEPEPDASAVPLDVLLQPGEAVTTPRVFKVPADTGELGLITGHSGPYCMFPGPLIIGSGGCVFHKPEMVRIE